MTNNLTMTNNILATCDRCGPAVRATARWAKGDTELEFCTHHSKTLGAKLREAGFTSGANRCAFQLLEPAGTAR